MGFLNKKQKKKKPEPAQAENALQATQPAGETASAIPEAPVIHQRKSRRVVNKQSVTPADVANSVRASLLKRKLINSAGNAEKHNEDTQSPFNVFVDYANEGTGLPVLPEDIASAFELTSGSSEQLPSDLADAGAGDNGSYAEDEGGSDSRRFFFSASPDEDSQETQFDLNSIGSDSYSAENTESAEENDYSSAADRTQTDDSRSDASTVQEDAGKTGQIPVPAMEADFKNVLGRLVDATKGYNTCRHTDKDKFQIVYYSDSVKAAKVSDGVISLSNNKVYVDGRLSEWDDCFEIKVKAGSQVEIETGIGFSIPDGCRLEVSCSRKQAEKYYFKPASVLLDSRDAMGPLVVSLSALEGAYLSKIGRIIECQIVES